MSAVPNDAAMNEGHAFCGSDDWKARVAASKFIEWPEYGRATTGHIGLQDHGSRVAYRNVKVRPLR